MIRLAFALLFLAACVTPPPEFVFRQLPPREASAGAPPLLVLLHGYGADENDLVSLSQQLDPHFAIVSVRAPLHLDSGGYAWFPYGEYAHAHEVSDRVNRFLDAAVRATGADPHRVFLAGFSQGAMVSLDVALAHPERVAGAVVMSGRLLDRSPRAAAARAHLLVLHGTEDPRIDVAEARATRDALAAMHADVTYREFPMGHQITPESLAVADAWLRSRLAASP